MLLIRYSVSTQKFIVVVAFVDVVVAGGGGVVVVVTFNIYTFSKFMTDGLCVALKFYILLQFWGAPRI